MKIDYEKLIDEYWLFDNDFINIVVYAIVIWG